VRRLRSSVHWIAIAAEALSGLILIAITVLNLAAVFMRYVMLDSISWSEEIMRYASIWLTFLAAGAVSWNHEHLNMDLFTRLGGERVQRMQRCATHLLAAFFAGIVVWQGISYCMRNGWQTAPTTGFLMLYAYGSIVVGGLLLLLVELVKARDALVLPRLPDSPAGQLQ